jgi:hypothetical protein
MAPLVTTTPTTKLDTNHFDTARTLIDFTPAGTTTCVAVVPSA